MSKTVTIIPAQPGFASVMPYGSADDSDARGFEYIPVIAWRITDRDEGAAVEAITTAGEALSGYMQYPDGRIIDGERTFPNAEALARYLHEMWEERLKAADQLEAELAAGPTPSVST